MLLIVSVSCRYWCLQDFLATLACNGQRRIYPAAEVQIGHHTETPANKLQTQRESSQTQRELSQTALRLRAHSPRPTAILCNSQKPAGGLYFLHYSNYPIGQLSMLKVVRGYDRADRKGARRDRLACFRESADTTKLNERRSPTRQIGTLEAGCRYGGTRSRRSPARRVRTLQEVCGYDQVVHGEEARPDRPAQAKHEGQTQRNPEKL